jgi:hypothetical protein
MRTWKLIIIDVEKIQEFISIQGGKIKRWKYYKGKGGL